MAVFKCKMCGGTIEFVQGESIGICDSCGTKQTLPKIGNDHVAALYERANHFRRNNEYDKAMSVYEGILNEDPTDAEAYWSLVLCRYGIEYVEDYSLHRRVPTINRTQYTSIFADEDYKQAIAHADEEQRRVYEDEAGTIDEIQKGILEISEKEKPFDVFICYKETDANGRRTQDSVLANDLYHQLTDEGFNVFFSRITLEDKLGTMYEPYIFAALNSAKVMVVLGTCAEYFNSMWVKNEWSRYLNLIKSGAKKTLIPAYRDMNPYDLPDEFSNLQALDMSKLGFMQDLIRGIKKIVYGTENSGFSSKVPIVVSGGVNTEALLKRAFLYLEDGDWKRADDYFEKVLDCDAENSQAYIGKLMAELEVHQREDLAQSEVSFEANRLFKNAIRFGSKEEVAELNSYVQKNKDRKELDRQANLYNQAISMMNSAKTSRDFAEAQMLLSSIRGYKDAELLSVSCIEKAKEFQIKEEEKQKEDVYKKASLIAEVDIIPEIEKAIALYSTIRGWKDADEQIYNCQKRINEIQRSDEEKKKRKKRRITISIVALIFLAILSVVGYLYIIPKAKEMYYISKYGKEKYELVKSIKVGEYYEFGSYELDGDLTDGSESIQWIVLKKDGMTVQLCSRYILDYQSFNASERDITWKTSSLRTWLNGEFFLSAFSPDEQKKVMSTNVKAEDNSKYGTKGGDATKDKVYLLSEDELYALVDSGIVDASCPHTQYNKSLRGQYGYWLRSPGDTQNNAAVYQGDWTVNPHLSPVEEQGIRPVIWIDLSK